MISLTEDNKMLGYGLLQTFSGICHFVTTRKGGCSEGAYASFNCSPYSGDRTESVARNQQLLYEGLPQLPRRLVIPRQVHGMEILAVNRAFSQSSAEEQQRQLQGVDALITDLPGYCLCVSTADCVPLLLYDRKNRAVAAIHAGWRGTVQSIVSITLKKMAESYGTQGCDLVTAIGPSISPESFEVGDEVCDAFREKGFDMNRISFLNEATDRYHIDLWEANRLQLLQFGVPERQIEASGICTYIHYEDFFSARRLGVDSGRIVSGIAMID